MAATSHKIKLYTSHGCPWAHRAHIALAELNVPFQEEIVDLSVPRTREYLKVNPRGLVPALEFDGQVVTESGIVAAFLADAYPQAGLVPASTDANGPLARARIAFFVDTYFSKAVGHAQKAVAAYADGEAAQQPALADFVAAVVKEIEPLLADAAPFFGGSSKLTLAEVQTGSFLLRLYAYIKHGLWAKATIAHESVTCVWDEDRVIAHSRYRFAKK
ncbi:Glutathione S-transferase domain-containing protein [Apiospora phragmitis]|uniref:Glutathione S-transferase domain-containing protein n=1 Tax=Apiospora phragmitis TaxID=2905665 RepID=A0ABR1VCR4_9PEZI